MITATTMALSTFWRRDPVRTRILLLALTSVVAVAACGGSDRAPAPASSSSPLVAATIFPIADLTAAVAGPAATVITMLPPGANPATFEPTPDLLRRLSGAGLVVAVGAGADAWAAGLARGSGARLLTLSEGLTLQYGNNPHIWLDPVVVRDVLLPRLTDALVQLAPAASAGIRTRSAAYRQLLDALDAEIRSTLAGLDSRAFVATHPAWPYFAARYGLDQVGVLYPSPGRELSPREFAALVDRARAAGVRAVFTEPQLGDTAVRALADELHARVGILDPLGGPAVAGRDSYTALLRFDARQFAQALGTRP